MICKPSDYADPRYLEVLEFVKRCIPKLTFTSVTQPTQEELELHTKDYVKI